MPMEGLVVPEMHKVIMEIHEPFEKTWFCLLLFSLIQELFKQKILFRSYSDVSFISSTEPASGDLTDTSPYQWQDGTTFSISDFQNLPGQTTLTCDLGYIMTTIWNREKIPSSSYVAYANAGKFKGKNCKSLEEQSKNVFPSILI